MLARGVTVRHGRGQSMQVIRGRVAGAEHCRMALPLSKILLLGGDSGDADSLIFLPQVFCRPPLDSA